MAMAVSKFDHVEMSFDHRENFTPLKPDIVTLKHDEQQEIEKKAVTSPISVVDVPISKQMKEITETRNFIFYPKSSLIKPFKKAKKGTVERSKDLLLRIFPELKDTKITKDDIDSIFERIRK